MSHLSSVSSHEDEVSDSGESDHSASSHSRCNSSNYIPFTAVQTHEQNREAATSLETAWTDSKHSSYLNFMEANFVKNMFGSSYCSEDVCGRTSYHHQYADIDECDEDSAQSRLHIPYESMEFKMCDRGGDWTWRPASRPMEPAGIPWVLLKNPWVNHFRPKNSTTMPSTLLSSRKDEVSSMVSLSPKVTGSTDEQLHRVNAHEVASSSNPGNENSKTRLTLRGRRIDSLEAGQTKQWIHKPLLDQKVDADVSNTKKRALWSTYNQVSITRQKIDNEVECSGRYGTNDQDDTSSFDVIARDSASEEFGNLVEES